MKHIAALSAAMGLVLVSQAQTIHEIHVLDDVFAPATLTIELGDVVHIIFDDADHTFTQVTEGVWLAEEATPLPGGYRFGDGTANPGTDFTITPPAIDTIWYICENHIDMGMKGRIYVTAANGIEEARMQDAFRLAPNPANDRIEILSQARPPVMVMIYDATGNRCMTATPEAGTILPVGSLTQGIYFMEIRDRDQRLLSRQRFVVAR